MVTSAILCVAALLGAQDSVLPHQTFDKDEGGWIAVQAVGAGSTVAVTHEPAHVKVPGGGSLAFKYKVATGQIGVAVHSIERGKLATMQSMHFWVQSDYETGLIVSLQEHEGGRYAAMFHVPKGKWQEVNIGLSDFILSTDADAPKDPDGKLDTDQIESVSILDVDEFLFQSEAFAKALGVEAGSHSLYVSDFKISDAKLADSTIQTAGAFHPDDFSRPQVGWIGFGVTGLTYAVDSPFPGKWMKAEYVSNASKVCGLAKPIKLGVLTAMKNISLQVGSARPVQLLVQLEQVNGAKFMTIIDVPGKAESKQFDIPISKLTLSTESPDQNAKMDLAQVKQLVIVDVSGLTLGSDQDNTLYIGPVAVTS